MKLVYSCMTNNAYKLRQERVGVVENVEQGSLKTYLRRLVCECGIQIKIFC